MTEKPLTKNIRPDRSPLSLKEYEAAGGYQGLRKALKEMSPKDVQKVVTDSNLRGRGGAGFPTGQKWSFVPMGAGAPTPKYLVCNADEGDPGAWVNRVMMESDPHTILEGMLIGAYATGALGEDAAGEVIRHADECAECQAALAVLDDAEDALIAQLRRSSTPPSPLTS